MNYGFALRAQSQLGLPLAKKDTHIDLTKMRFSQNHILVSHKRNMEFFQGLHAFIHRTQSQTVELDALCEYTTEKWSIGWKAKPKPVEVSIFRIIYNSR